MRYAGFALSAILAAGSTTLVPAKFNPLLRRIVEVDTVYVNAPPIDYAEVARRVAQISRPQQGPMTIDGDLIVKGRIGVGGTPEPNTNYMVTVHGARDAGILFIANEALNDGQRVGTEHRHVGGVGVSHDGGLRMDQNAVCFNDGRGCVVDDRRRRRAYSGYDSMGDMSFFLSDVDSLTGQATAPPMQSLVLSLLAWDGSIKFTAHRPGQRIFFQGSTTPRAADLQWEVPLH
jgi:hypothetical protein